MRKAAYGVLTAMLTVLLVAVTLGASLSVDNLLGRYPGSVRSAGGQVDWDYLHRGWLSRHTVYVTDAPRPAVEAWYAQRYPPNPEAGTREVSGCTPFRATRVLVRVVYAVSVALCRVPAGTRIVVNESAYYSPQPPRQATP